MMKESVNSDDNIKAANAHNTKIVLHGGVSQQVAPASLMVVVMAVGAVWLQLYN